MSKITTPPTVPKLVKPTLDTPFHIDYAWWERKGLHINVELRAHLCQEHHTVFSDHFDTEEIDWVDKKTGEVTKVDGLQHVLQVHCSKQPDYINDDISLVDAVFRVDLSSAGLVGSDWEVSFAAKSEGASAVQVSFSTDGVDYDLLLTETLGTAEEVSHLITYVASRYADFVAGQTFYIDGGASIWGEQWFMQHLVDGDPAANNGGWQWTAGTGTDAAPYFCIFNPVAQSQRHDPQGTYIRNYVPELARVLDRFIHEPWKMPAAIQEEVGCTIGQDYPAPVVDHQWARKRALAAYKKARG